MLITKKKKKKKLCCFFYINIDNCVCFCLARSRKRSFVGEHDLLYVMELCVAVVSAATTSQLSVVCCICNTKLVIQRCYLLPGVFYTNGIVTLKFGGNYSSFTLKVVCK